MVIEFCLSSQFINDFPRLAVVQPLILPTLKLRSVGIDWYVSELFVTLQREREPILPCLNALSKNGRITMNWFPE